MIDFSAIAGGSLLGKALRLPLALLPGHLVVPILGGPARGLRWRVGSMNHGCWIGTYELAKQRALARAIQPGMTFWDVGANVGFYSLLASRLVGAVGQVVAFEPLPANVEALSSHLALNRVTNCTVVAGALGAQPGLSSFARGASHAEGRLAQSAQPLRVGVQAVDALLAGGALPVPDVVKMDVEGSEAAVLSGARTFLAARRAIWFVATHDDEQKDRCEKLLRDAGYQIRGLDGAIVTGPLTAVPTDEFCATPH